MRLSDGLYILIPALVIIIIYLYNVLKKNNIYCNKFNICIKLDDSDYDKFIQVKNELIAFYRSLINVLPDDDKKVRLVKKFDINGIFEVYPNNTDDDTSYSVNKGEEMGLCIRSGKDFYKIHDLDIIKFVFIHELAHVASISEQHTDEFWKNFKYLLKVAYNYKLLNEVNYNTNYTEYCGMEVTYSPYYDNNIQL